MFESSVFISLIICSFSYPIVALKNIEVINTHGEFTKAFAEANTDAEFILVENSTLTSYPLSAFSIMTNVRKLVLENTKIIQPMDHNIYASGRKLKELIFSNNEINEYPLIVFYNTSLENVKIHSQPKVKIIPKAFAAESVNLKYFQCSECKITTIEDGAFLNLEKLEDLNLQDNLIEKLTEETFKPLKSLKNLNLAGNKLTTFTTNEIKHLTKLESIDLTKNPLKTLNLLDAAGSLPNLKTVSLIDTEIPEAIIEEHKKKTNIRFITESDNKISN